MKLLAVFAAAILIASGFFPWVYIASKQLTITGTDAMNFGKPAYLHFVFAGFCLLFLFINKGWSHKVALFFAAFNVAWAIRNFFLITACSMGECPEKQPAIYVLIGASILLLVALLLWTKKPQRQSGL